MAITTAERTNILKLVVAMFNAPAGSTYLSEITSVFEANGRSLSALAQTLSTTGAFKALHPNFQSSSEFAAKFLTPYGLQNNAIAVDWVISKLNAGVNKGQIALEAATAIDAYTGTDAGLIAAKSIQNNKTAVAEYYSVTKAIPQTDLAQLQLAFNGVTAEASSVAAANATIDGTTGTAAFNLTTGFDSLFATAGADNFVANVVQNSLGQQVNTLGSGDTLNGGGGSDTLSAKVTAGVFAGGPAGSSPIQAITKSIETIKLQAVNSTIGSTTEVYVNARDMASVSKISSNYSDANLVVQNLTTLNDSGVATRLANMTVGMEYTGNKDTRWEEADTSVYFDQDYLSRDLTFSNPSIDLRLMNEDAYDVTFGTANFRPLTSVFVDKLDITLNGVGYSLAQYIPENRGPAGRGTEIETYSQLLSAIQAAITALKAANPAVAAVQSLTANFGANFLADISPVSGLRREGQSITISADGQTNGVANTLIINPTDLVLAPAKGIRTDNGDIGNNNRFERAGNTPAVQGTELLTINVALEKAGLAGAGGELVVGSMFKDSTNTWQDQFAGKGIEKFNVTVSGGTDKPSSLSGLHSTGNNLREVIVKTNAAQASNFSSLTIGNSNTDSGGLAPAATPLGKVAPGSIAVAGTVFQPSAANANALKDVRVFNAADLKGDLTLFAGITSESVAKYMNLKDGAPAAAAADNVSFQYTGGAGNDYINLHLSEANLAAAGTTTREDFTLTVSGGAGNDEIVTKIGDGQVAAGANWYQNSKINANMTINGGAGNDTIRKLGAGDFVINGDDGADVVYADNSGTGAVYVFNVADGDAAAAGNQYNIGNLLSQQAATVSAVNANLTVTFKGLTATAVIGNSAGSLTNVAINDLSVNQAIKAAINLDPVLSKLLVAEDGPGRSLVVRSLIDGADVTPADLSVAFGTTGALSAAQLAAVPAPTLFSAPADLADGYVTNFAQNAGGAAAAPAVAAVPAATEVATMTGASGLTAGQTYTVAGLTFTAAAGGVTQTQLLDAFANVTNGGVGAAAAAQGTYTGTLTGYSTGGVVANAVTFTSATASTPVVDLTDSGTGAAAAAIAVTTQGTAGSAAVAGVNEITGTNSTSPSDNTINGGTGNDVIVLGTTVGTTALTASNDTVVFGTGFGSDVVVNFTVGDPAAVVNADVLNFVALGGDVNAGGTNFSQGAVNNLDKSVSIVTTAAAANTAALVAAAYTDSATAVTHVYVAVDVATNIGSVYSITDQAGTAAGNVTAVLVGTLDLADTVYSTLVYQNVA